MIRPTFHPPATKLHLDPSAGPEKVEEMGKRKNGTREAERAIDINTHSSLLLFTRPPARARKACMHVRTREGVGVKKRIVQHYPTTERSTPCSAASTAASSCCTATTIPTRPGGPTGRRHCRGRVQEAPAVSRRRGTAAGRRALAHPWDLTERARHGLVRGIRDAHHMHVGRLGASRCGSRMVPSWRETAPTARGTVGVDWTVCFGCEKNGGMS